VGRLIFISILLQMWVLKNWKGIMDYATLGNTDLLVSKLCFGTVIFGGGRGIFKARSQAVISNAKSFPSWNPKRSASRVESAGRGLAFRQDSRTNQKPADSRAAFTTTFPSWTKSRFGDSSK
jgi:hypothetical protein